MVKGSSCILRTFLRNFLPTILDDQVPRSLHSRRSDKTPPLKPPSLSLLSSSRMIVVDKNHDLASQVVVTTPTGVDGIDAKHKRRRHSRAGSKLREEDHVKPVCREIGIQVEIREPVPKKSPGRFLSFGKRTESANGIRRVSLEIEIDAICSTKKVENVETSNQTSVEAPTEEPRVEPSAMTEMTDTKKSRKLSKKTPKIRDKNIFNKVRKMSQFISALKNSTTIKRRKAEENIAAEVQNNPVEFGNSGQCCEVHNSSSCSVAKGETPFGNVTFEERSVKENNYLGLPNLHVKFSKVFYF